MKKIFFIGRGGHFKDVFGWYVDQLKHKKLHSEIKGIIDNDKTDLKHDSFSKLKIYKFKDLKVAKDIYLILAIGNMNIRKKIINKFCKYKFETCIHPRAIVSQNCFYKKGNIFGPNSIITGNAKIGNFNNFSQNSTATHDCIIGNNNFFSPSSSIMGNCVIGNNNFFGVSSNMIPGIKIGDDNIVGANSTIIKTENSCKNTFIGVPGQIKK